MTVASSFFISFSKMTKRIETKQELINLNNEIQAITGSQATCTAALVPGQTFDENLADDPSRDANGVIDLSTNTGLDFSLVLSSGDQLASNSTDCLNGYNLRVDALKIFNAQLAGAIGADQLWKVELVGSFSGYISGRDVEFAPRTLSHFYIKTDASNAITECYNINPNDPQSIADIMNIFCTKLGGTMNNGNCEGVGGNSSLGLCPNGQVMRGVDPNGNSVCVAAATPVNQPPANNGTWNRISFNLTPTGPPSALQVMQGNTGNCPGTPTQGGVCAPRGLNCDFYATLGLYNYRSERWRCL